MNYWSIDKKDEKPHFNISKLHSITHYINQIRLFGSAVGMNSAHFKVTHKYHMKVFFNRTNKQKDEFEQQILLHNTWLINFLAMKDVLDYCVSRSVTQAEKDDRAKVTKFSESLNLFKWHLNSMKLSKLQETRLSKRHWCETDMIALYLKILDLIDALTVFVRKCRKQTDCINILNSELDHQNSDSSWVSSYYISIHLSITCWKQKTKNSANIEKLSSELVCCHSEWQDKLSNWRQDYVFVQKYEKSSNDCQKDSSIMKDKMMRHLQLIMTVVDSERKNKRDDCLRYTDALIELLWFWNSGVIDHHHDMMKVETWHASNARNHCNISVWWFYQMFTILHSAHVISTELWDDTYYINNYINWKTYNTIYDSDFFSQEIRMTCAYEKQIRC